MLSNGSVLAAIGIAVLLVGAFIAGQVSGVNLARLARSDRGDDKGDDAKA